jgi:hypothetical protein
VVFFVFLQSVEGCMRENLTDFLILMVLECWLFVYQIRFLCFWHNNFNVFAQVYVVRNICEMNSVV